MGSVHPLLYRATPEEYHQQAEALFDALKSGDEAAEWRFKWEAPTFPWEVGDRGESRNAQCGGRATGRRA
jgi:hypothetical protein